MWIKKISEKSARLINFVKNIWIFFIDFCNNSTIHGVRYFTERRLHWSERLWWVIAFAVSVWLCSLSVRSIWMQWQNNPVTMDFSEKGTPISEIPFPTITICSGIKVKKDSMDLPEYFLSNNLTTSGPTDHRIQTLAHICENFNYMLKFHDSFTSESIYDTMKSLAPTFESTLQWGFWKEERFGCCKYFVPVFTMEGLCFAFNALNSNEVYTEEMVPAMMTAKGNPNGKQWNLEKGYIHRPSETEYPFRIFYSGDRVGLILVLHVYYSELEYVCETARLTFKISFTMPGEVLSRRIFEAPFYSNTLIGIKPKMITTSNGLRNYEPKQRKCFYQSERRLRFFKMYTQANCEEECLANFTKIVCGCVMFSMPRDINTKICGAANINCYLNAEKKLYGGDVNDNNTIKVFRDQCNCWPSCTSIKYDADVSHSKFDQNIMKSSFGEKSFDTQATFIRIFFKDRQVNTSRRMETYTLTDFMAICGGLLGLFLGISLLSIIEFIYYSTLRLYWTIRRSRSVMPSRGAAINTVFY